MDAKKVEQELEDARRRPLGKRLKAALTLPGELRKVVDNASKKRWAYHARRAIEVQAKIVRKHFAGIADARRNKLIRSLLPNFADAAEQAWSTLARRPYQDEGTRKPFRAPAGSEELDVRRGSWLLEQSAKFGDLDRDIVWLAKWAAHISSYGEATEIGWLLAGALDRGDATSDEVFEILKDSASGEHEIGAMGRHVTQAMMSCGREDAWEFNEKLLLAAQRQEGLRQTILESIDESHPEAFRRMLRLILEHDLARFSSVVRAFDTWFGFMWDGSSGIKVNEVLEKVLRCFDDDAQRDRALAGDDPETAYLALWTLAFEDVESAVAPAARLLEHESAEMRFVAMHLLAQTQWTTAVAHAQRMLADDDLRVAARAFLCVAETEPSHETFAALEPLLGRFRRKTVKLPSIVWPWWEMKIERTEIADQLIRHGKGMPQSRLMPYVNDLDSWDRAGFVREAAGLDRWAQGDAMRKPKVLTGGTYELAVALIGDASPDARKAAFASLASTEVQAAERDHLVELLRRKASDLRSGVLARLSRLDDDELLATAATLMRNKDAMRRLAGLELVRDAVEKDRCTEQARALARDVFAQREPTDGERAHLDTILGDRTEVASRDDCLGLIDGGARMQWQRPSAKAPTDPTKAARAALESLAQLVLDHGDTEIVDLFGDRTTLLDAGRSIGDPGNRELAEQREGKLPLVDVWQQWQRGRGTELRDQDGLELVRAWVADDASKIWGGPTTRKLAGSEAWSSGRQLLSCLLEWAIFWQRPEGAFAHFVDGIAHELGRLTRGQLRTLADQGHHRVWNSEKPHDRIVDRASHLQQRYRRLQDLLPSQVDEATARRAYATLRWFQLETGSRSRLGPNLREFRAAADAGLFDDPTAELTQLLIGPTADRDLLSQCTGHKPCKEFADHSTFATTIQRIRERLVEVETRRGDRTTAASALTIGLRHTGGLDTLGAAMKALGSTKFARSYSWWGDEPSRKDTLSHLVINSIPRPEDTHDAFVEWADASGIKQARLVELATYAPQWAPHVNAVLGWDGLENGVWWIHAHTKDDSWNGKELKEQWTAQVSERTPLSASDLTEGAVDVAWFHDAYGRLGAERWQALDKAAKYASSSGGHKRAQLFADAMRGTTTHDELLARIDEKRHQDSVRALGLLPLATGKGRDADLLARYRALQEFRRQSRKFGSQRQQSEGRATAIGLENLARTAGFKDPLRLQWAMEMDAIADLRDGPVVVTKGDTVLTLSIDEQGKPDLAVHKGERKLKSVPARLNKDADVVELKARLKELRRQASRVQGALEESMCRGDAFEADELRQLLQHPILAPSLRRLVFLGDDIAGYLEKDGRVLVDHAGTTEPIRKTETLRLAHPHDLLDRGDWASWQRDCYRRERIQPFKQVFRETYPLTAAERDEGKRSKRYAGHQVGPRRALALLGKRGWVAQPEEGVSRTFHAEGVTARLTFQEAFYSPADIEGLTLEDVVFTRKGEHDPLQLVDVPPRVFSEAMRDMDLVVSVAHEGGVDPEASASTVEMRANLMRETCRLLDIDNVEVLDHHALIKGSLADYSLHLGSAVASVRGGLSLAIVAVHSQHRGRLFLPFADDDPRTAEVLSKMLLLARDRELKDPGILEQIRRANG
jgi:hypothetical protein